jgi:hypothetical protein
MIRATAACKEASMKLRSRIVTAIAVLLASVTALPLARPALAADPPVSVTLPIDGFAALALDEPGGRLFVSTGPGRAEVLVTDLAGVELRRLGNLPGASGLLTQDGTLYVALHDAGAITALDLASLTETRRFDLPAGTCPDELAWTAGRLVFIAPPCAGSPPFSRLGTLDPASGDVVVADGPAGSDHPVLAANSASDGLVAVANADLSPSRLAVYDVRDGAPRFLRADDGSHNIREIAMAPDGRSVLVSGVFVVPLDTLAYGRPVTEGGVGAWSADGSRLVIGDDGFLLVWPVGGNASLSGLRMLSSGIAHRGLAIDVAASRAWVVSRGVFPTDPINLARYDLAPNGTEWTVSPAQTVQPEFTPVELRADLRVAGAPVPDGTRLVVLVEEPDGTTRADEYFAQDGGITISTVALRGATRYRFSHYDDPTRTFGRAVADVIGTFTTQFNVTEPPSPVNPGQQLSWFAQLTDSDGRALPGERIRLLRTGGESDVVVDEGLTDQFGYVELRDTADTVGTFTYVLSYAGSESASPARHETVLVVEKFPGVVSITATLGTRRDRRTATVTASLGIWHTNRTVTITALPDGGTATVIAEGEVTDDGTLTVTYPMRRATTFTVTYAGDDWYTAAEASTRLTLR